MRDVVISSGQVNRYGYRIKPEGILYDAYLKNPVLTVLHDGRILSIGKVNDIRFDKDGAMIGTPEFDEGDPLALDVKRKWEKGYLNAVSIEHLPITTTEDPAELLPGQTRHTVTATDLLEISIVNKPGDRGAVALSMVDNDLDNKIPLLKLSTPQSQQPKIIPDMGFEKIATALGLVSTASEDVIIESIKQLSAKATAATQLSIDTLVQVGKQGGFVSDDNEPSIRKLAAQDFDSAKQLIDVQVKKLSIEKKDEPTPGSQKLSTVKDAIDDAKSKQIPGKEGEEAETFEMLSRDNPERLNEIRKTDPARYQKLASEYKPGKKA
jgi:hypothetical protein